MLVYIPVHLPIIHWNGLNHNFLKMKGLAHDLVHDCINEERQKYFLYTHKVLYDKFFNIIIFEAMKLNEKVKKILI